MGLRVAAENPAANGRLSPEVLEAGRLPIRDGVYVVTPGWARWVLDTFNTHNRNVIRGAIGRYAADMRAGRWQLTHQGIALSSAPVFLIDGQNRLSAVDEAGVPVAMRVFVGLSPETQLAVDEGVVRRVHDALTLSGVEATTKHVSVANVMLAGPATNLNCQALRMTKAQMRDFLLKHRDAVYFAVAAFPSNVVGVCTAPVIGVVGRAYYHVEDRERLARFAKILTLNHPCGDDSPGVRSVFTLRKLLTDDRGGSKSRTGGKSGLSRAAVYQKTQRVLRAYLDDEEITRVYGVDDDLFPMPAEEEKA